MPGDYTRFTFQPHRRYSGVWMQQGRAQLDADWIEGVEILKRRVRTLALDTFGPVGLPLLTTPNAFLISIIGGPPVDLGIGAGRLYVDGWVAEIFPDEAFTYLAQPYLPDPPPLPDGNVAVFLDVWQREITYIEDPSIADVALGGADTATRTQTVWQVRFAEVDAARCGVDVGDPPSAGRLTTQAFAPPAPDDPCLLAPQSGYRGLENRLYRVEIHDGGALGTARFKWSRDNGSIVSAVTALAVAGGQTTLTVMRIGRDQVLRFRIDDWVTVTDDHRELHGEPGEMARIVDIDEAQSQIVLDRAIPSGGTRAFGANATELDERHTRVQRWDETQATNTIDGDGLIDTAAGPIDLEDGVQVSFATDPAGGSFRPGDYWVFAARTADASVEILTDARPRGIHHHYVQLAAISGLGGADPIPADCRPRPEDGHDRCCCCLVTVGSREGQPGDFLTLESAIAALPNLAPDPQVPVIVCLLEGDHRVRELVRVTRPRVTIRGCGWGTRLLTGSQGALRLEETEQAVESLAILGETELPLIDVAGSSARIEECKIENQGPGPAVLAQSKAADLVIRGNLVLGTGGLDLTGNVIDVAANRIVHGIVRIRRRSQRVRIRENDILQASTDAVSIADEGVVYDVEVTGNRILKARRNGIVSGNFDPEEQGGKDPIIFRLTVADNEITDCVAEDVKRDTSDPPFGGIVLARVYNLTVRDNRIERNGQQASSAVCGIFVRHSRGVEISRNMIRSNGREPDGQTFPGPQAGISLRDASILVDTATDSTGTVVAAVDIMPAARIADNFVDSPRGPALYIRGQGPMVVTGNRFKAIDVLGDFSDATFATIDQYVGTVFLYNTGLPVYFSAYLAGAGLSGLASGSPKSLSGSPLLTGLIVGGQTQFCGNQARLDLARRAADMVMANVAILSLDDVVISGNQTEGILFGQLTDGVSPGSFQGDLLLADVLNLAITTRQTHNGLMTTPILTIFSIFSQAFVNHCLENQATSCIRAVGVSPKSVVRDNAVMFANPLFCKEQ